MTPYVRAGPNFGHALKLHHDLLLGARNTGVHVHVSKESKISALLLEQHIVGGEKV